MKIGSLASLLVVTIHAVVTKELTPPKDWVVYQLEIDCGTVRDTIIQKCAVCESSLWGEVHAFIARDALIHLSYLHS